MATLSQSTTPYTATNSWLTTYTTFVDNAEFNRIGWAATAIALQGCILSPVLLLVMAYYGGGDWQFLVSMSGFLCVLIPILSAMSVRYIFPAFALSVVVHLIVILVDLL